MNRRILLTLGLSVGVVAAALVAPVLRARAQEAAPAIEADAAPEEPAIAEVTEPEPAAQPEPEAPVAEVVVQDAPRTVDIVIALDTSGSMDGLIDSTRARLWDVVNQAVVAQPSPQVRVGLVTFGTPTGSSPAEGFVTRRMDLTTDLDGFYEELMGLRTNGGDEYVGWALSTSIDQMSWSDDPGSVKMLFVAGNESADQAPEQRNFRVYAPKALEAGITVHSLFAGDVDSGRQLKWDQVAAMGGGTYAAIDQNRSVAAIATPFDAQLVSLDDQLNQTYVAFGRHGQAGLMNQQKQDLNASNYGSRSSRASTKASGSYRNASWDLVDAQQYEQRQLADIPDADLPEPMRGMTLEQKTAYVNGKAAERKRLQQQIAAVNAERSQWLATARAEAVGQSGLDDAMRGMVVDTMVSAGFAF